MKRGYRVLRMHFDKVKIIDEWTNREMLYMGKDYGDVERVIDIFRWMGLEFHDYWQDECDKDLKKLGISK